MVCIKSIVTLFSDKFNRSFKIVFVSTREGNLLYILEKEIIQRTLKKMNSNRRKTAKALDISERTLYRKINEYGLDKKKNGE